LAPISKQVEDHCQDEEGSEGEIGSSEIEYNVPMMIVIDPFMIKINTYI
jgi:hypothetical protein